MRCYSKDPAENQINAAGGRNTNDRTRYVKAAYEVAEAAAKSGDLVGRCRLPVLKPVLKVPMVSALEATII